MKEVPSFVYPDCSTIYWLKLQPHKEIHVRKTRIFIFVVLLTMLLAACSSGQAQKGDVQIGSKEFTEQYILGNLYQILLNDAGYNASYNSVGGSSEAHQALINGDIDVYPEYTGTALLTHLGMEYSSDMSRSDVYNTVNQAYQEQFNLTLGEPTEFNNTYCLTMPQALSQETGITTVSELANNADGLVFGTTQEFTERPDGLPGLRETYGPFNFDDVAALDPGLLYAGLEQGDIDVTTCFGTDGQIAAYNLVVLDDDQNFWPPYPAAPVFRQDFVQENPEVVEILNQLAPLLDGETMSALNWEVAGNGREADEVAREFLIENGLISQ